MFPTLILPTPLRPYARGLGSGVWVDGLDFVGVSLDSFEFFELIPPFFFRLFYQNFT